MIRKSFVFISALLLLSSCADKNVYEVKGYKYFSEDEVHMDVISNGHSEKMICAFPPNTDFKKMKKVHIGSIKAENLLSAPLYNCQIVE